MFRQSNAIHVGPCLTWCQYNIENRLKSILNEKLPKSRLFVVFLSNESYCHLNINSTASVVCYVQNFKPNGCSKITASENEIARGIS